MFYMLAVVIGIGLPMLLFELYMLRAPRDGRTWLRVIYTGVPGWLEDRNDDPALRGPAAIIAQLHFNGHLMPYEGSYLSALIMWIRNTPKGRAR